MEYNRSLFNKFQQTILDKIGDSGLLSEDEFQLLCNPNFRIKQITNLFIWFVDEKNIEGLATNFEEKKIIANPEFSIKKMSELKCAASNKNVDINILKEMTQYDENTIRLYSTFLGFLERNRFSLDEIRHYVNMNFDKGQIDAICYGLETIKDNFEPLSKEELELYMTKDFDGKQMLQIYRGFIRDDDGAWISPLPIEKVKIYAKPDIKASDMAIMKSALKTDTPLESIKKYLEAGFSYEQSVEVADGIYYAYNYSEKLQRRVVDFDEVDFYADRRFDNKQMAELRSSYWSMKRGAVSMENILKIKNPDYDFRRMQILKKGFENGYDFEELKPLICSDLNDVQLLFIKDAFSYKFNYDQIRALANPDNTMLELMTYMDGFKLGVSLEKIKNILEADLNINCYELMVRSFYKIDNIKYLSYGDYCNIIEKNSRDGKYSNISNSITGSETPQNNKIIENLYMFENFNYRNYELTGTPYYDFLDGDYRGFENNSAFDIAMEDVDFEIGFENKNAKQLKK